ncbi:hypothetical protein DFH28DRAFT_920630 [Melampsora americana]|nr:hypothetical protein DFH28DRAFT_920630 [Melampsora americana]
MTQSTPASSKGSARKNLTSSLKKKGSGTPLAHLPRKVARLDTSTNSSEMVVDPPNGSSQSTLIESETKAPPTSQTAILVADTPPAEQGNMALDTPTSAPASGANSKRPHPGSDTASNDSISDTSASSDDDSSEDEIESGSPPDTIPVPEGPAPTSVLPEVIDDSLEITGGTLPTNITLIDRSYPAPGQLAIRNTNPVEDAGKYQLAPTVNLPVELRLWWNYYHEDYASAVDSQLWAMAVSLTDSKQRNGIDPRRQNPFETISDLLNPFVNHVSRIVGPGYDRFHLIRFRSSSARTRLMRKQDQFEHGVYVQQTGSVKSSVLIFDLDHISKLSPRMSSLLVQVFGLPFHLHHRTVAKEVYGAIWTQRENDYLKLIEVKELPSSPLHTNYGGRIFEFIFKPEAIPVWFRQIALINHLIPMSGWDARGKQTPRIFNAEVAYLPQCNQCFTSTHNAAHRPICPYLTIRDDLYFRHSIRRASFNSSGVSSVPQVSVAAQSETLAPSTVERMGSFTRTT